MYKFRKTSATPYLTTAIVSVAMLATAATASAQKFPDKPIQVVIHSSYGDEDYHLDRFVE